MYARWVNAIELGSNAYPPVGLANYTDRFLNPTGYSSTHDLHSATNRFMLSSMTQKARLLNYLETHDGITTREAGHNLEIWRLSERVRELEQCGVVIEHKHEKTSNGKWVVRYFLHGS